MVIKRKRIRGENLGALHKFKVKDLLSLKLIIAIIFALIVWGAIYYNYHVITYDKQLNVLINYIYDETAPDDAVTVYQKFLNMDSPYRERIKKNLGPAIISRFQYYANLYMLRKIQYEEYLQYEQIVTELFFSNDTVKDTEQEVKKYYESQRAYTYGANLQEQGRIEDAIQSYSQVMFNDQYYYDLAKEKIEVCIKLIKEQYITEASEYYEQKQYVKAISQLYYLANNGEDESVSSLIWYYQSEFYTALMKEITELIEEEQYGYLIKYLNEVRPYLGEQYEDTLNLALSDLTLKRAQRRDKALGKYNAKIQVASIPEANQQIIAPNQIQIPSFAAFNQVSYATQVFSSVKKYDSDEVTEDVVVEYANMMPYLTTNSEITSAALTVMFGVMNTEKINFNEVQLVVNGQSVFTYSVEANELRQVENEFSVIEWISVEIDDETIKEFISIPNENREMSILFIGQNGVQAYEIAPIEMEMLVMMSEIFEAIMK
ncbi:MAG TPA: hypothetical protein DCY20_04305 [Firmicutes bacterium]|nr:hypothetical protein [Bacillota bacterium]